MEFKEIFVTDKKTGEPVDRFSMFRKSPAQAWTAWTGDTICARTKQRRMSYADGSHISKRLKYEVVKKLDRK